MFIDCDSHFESGCCYQRLNNIYKQDWLQLSKKAAESAELNVCVGDYTQQYHSKCQLNILNTVSELKQIQVKPKFWH